MTDFLPKGYDVPQGGSNNFMKIQKGENRFRIMSEEAILGYVYWVGRDANGRGGTPKRVPMSTTIPTDEVDPTEIRHFWSFVVYNYALNKFQIMEITQRTIIRALKNLLANPAWDSPNGYDIVIIREGETKLDTKYNIQPQPPQKLDEKIMQAYKALNVDLTALFRNEDPLKAQS